MIALLYRCLSSENSAGKTAINALVLLWGVRLSGFLFYRIITINEDKRFDSMREDPLRFLGFWIFQMAWVWVVSSTVVFVNGTDDESTALTPGGIVGIVMSAVGLLMEGIADQEKFSFRQNPLNKTSWLRSGDPLTQVSR
jgi:steroid 5-alpha reductase family enzyme